MRIITEAQRRLELEYQDEKLVIMYRPANGAESLQVSHGLQASQAVEAVQKRLFAAQDDESFDASTDDAKELYGGVTRAVGDWHSFLLDVARAHLIRIGGIIDGNGEPLRQEGAELVDLLDIHARDLLQQAAVQIALDIVRAPTSGK
jgi:hypothetical protein